MGDVYDLNELPVELEDAGLPALFEFVPRPEPVPADFQGWQNWAGQRNVRDLAVAPDVGSLWLATGGGILRWYPRTKRFSRFGSEHGLPGNAVSAVAVDGRGQVWAAPDAGGLYHFSGERWLRCSLEHGRDRVPLTLTVDRDGLLWAGTQDGILALDERGKERRFLPFEAATLPRAMTVTGTGLVCLCNAQGLFVLDGNGQVGQLGRQPTLLTLALQGSVLWIGKIDGLVSYHLQTREVLSAPAWPSGPVTALVPLSDGVLAACGGQVGAAVKNTWQPVTSLGKGQQIRRMVLNHDPDSPETALLWLATADDLVRVDVTGGHAAPWRTEHPPDLVTGHGVAEPGMVMGNLVLSLAMDQRDAHRLWVGTSQGLFSLSLGGVATSPAWESFADIPANSLLAMAAGPSGGLWLGGWDGCLRCLRSGCMEHLMPTLPAPVLALSQGSDDGWWAVTLDGLYLGHGEGWSLVLPRSRLPLGCSLRTVAEDSAGRLWLGTSTGLRVYDLESERLLTTGSSFSLPVSALAYQAQGETLWVGTPRGLFRLKLHGAECQREASYSVRDSGLGADSVTALALDETPGATGLWIGTVCGLTRFWLERNER